MVAGAIARETIMSDVKTSLKVIAGDDAGNPFLSGLDLPEHAADIVTKIARNPFHSAVWKQSHRDYSLIDSYLKLVVAPTHRAIEIARLLYSAIRRAYVRRDMRTLEYRQRYFGGQTGDNFSPIQMDGMVIKGITGLGKTHMIEAALRSIPQVLVRDRTIPGMTYLWQVVWLKIEMTDVANLEALVMEIANALDRALEAYGVESAHYKMATLRGRSSGAKLTDLLRALETHGVGLIVFDEIKHENFGCDSAMRMREDILKLCNQGIAVALAGNPNGFWDETGELPVVHAKKHAENLLPSQVARRLSKGGHIRLNPSESPDDPDWQIFCRTLWTCQLLPKIGPASLDISHILHKVSAGFPDFGVVAFGAGQVLAAQRGHDALLPSDLLDGAQGSTLLKDMAPLIRAFHTRDSILLRRVEDANATYYDRLWKPAPNLPVSAENPTAGFIETALPIDTKQQESLLRQMAAATKGSVSRTLSRRQREPSATVQEMVPYHLDQLDLIITKKNKTTKTNWEEDK
jgi:hypothetical protein